MVSRFRPPRFPGLGISEGLRRHAEWLMDQEMWCLGRDIRHPEGDALIRAGFQVWRPPTNVVGGNGYTWTMPDGGRLTLWAFGLCYTFKPESGLLYLSRFQFRLTWRPEAE